MIALLFPPVHSVAAFQVNNQSGLLISSVNMGYFHLLVISHHVQIVELIKTEVELHL